MTVTSSTVVSKGPSFTPLIRSRPLLAVVEGFKCIDVTRSLLFPFFRANATTVKYTLERERGGVFGQQSSALDGPLP